MYVLRKAYQFSRGTLRIVPSHDILTAFGLESSSIAGLQRNLDPIDISTSYMFEDC